jgi:sugar/nucleoside kinase (ribokinase family)
MKEIHVTVLTNAIVDILAHVENDFLKRHDLQKGGYKITSQSAMEDLYSKIPPATEQSGGSLANTAAVLSLLGAKTCCLAKVTDDAFGKIFMHDMKAGGVIFPIPPSKSEEATGRSIILIDEEGDRCMNTNLGSSIDISPEDLCLESIKKAHILCVEGYFWSDDRTKKSAYQAIETAKQSGTQVVFGLSAEWCVKTFREEFETLIKSSVDILLGNELEYLALFEKSIDDTVEQLKTLNVLCVITRGPQGSIVVKGEEVLYIPSVPSKYFVDATGAGDTYASGFLYGLTHGFSLEESAKLGSLIASATIAQVGARPDQSIIRKTVQEAGYKIG